MEHNTGHFQVVPPLTDEPSVSTEDGAALGAEQGSTRKRQRSTIEFPYNDLADAIEVANAIHERAGGGCAPDQLAAWLGHQSVKSGTFRMKLSAARLFGLVEVGRDKIVLTRLAQQVVDPTHDARQPLVSAFLNVPLYRHIYNKFRGHQLPPDHGLEQAMINLGVSPKQGDKARQAFQRSAERAGMFYQGRTRLVLPAGTSETQGGPLPNGNSTQDVREQDVDVPSTPKHERKERGGTFNGGGDQVGQQKHHTLINGLVQMLPPDGEVWEEQDRQTWIKLAQSIFDMIYMKPDGS